MARLTEQMPVSSGRVTQARSRLVCYQRPAAQRIISSVTTGMCSTRRRRNTLCVSGRISPGWGDGVNGIRWATLVLEASINTYGDRPSFLLTHLDLPVSWVAYGAESKT